MARLLTLPLEKKSSEGFIFNKYLERRMIRNNKNVLIAITGPTGCLSKDTIIAGQTKTLGELYKSGEKIIDTISLMKCQKGSGGYYPKHSKSEIIHSGIKEVFEIELEDGRKVIATNEHKFFKQTSHIFVEETLKNLKVGDMLRAFPRDYFDNFFNKAKKKEQKKRNEQYNPKSLCKKCHTLFYQEKKGEGFAKQLCKSCLEPTTKSPQNRWYEWEDNLLRKFYYSYPKEKLMELLPSRKTWTTITHRAKRLNLKRKPEFQWEQNAWTSKNNPVHNPILFEKMMSRQVPIFKRNKMTSIEKKIANLLDTNHIKYEFNKVVRTKTSFRFPDFQIGNLIIECDGIYWHKQRELEDKKREMELKELGFEIIRFTDKEINNNWENVKQCIQQKLNQ